MTDVYIDRAAERRRAQELLEDVGERVRRAVQIGRCLDDAARAVAELRPLLKSGALADRVVEARIGYWMEDAGEPPGHGAALAGWLWQVASEAAFTKPPAREHERRVIEIAPGTLSVVRHRSASDDPDQARRVANEAGTLAALVDQAQAALIEARLGLYQRGGAVVRAARVIDRTAKGGEREIVRVVDVSDVYLTELLGQAAQFERRNEKTGATAAVACPPVIAKSYIARNGIGWALRELRGVISAPTLREDGSVLDVPGFDARTGLIYDPRGEPEPEIPQQPTYHSATMALLELQELLTEFPFVSGQDEAVALAAILTATIRRNLPASPLFAFTAPSPGTGKSYLVDLASLIAFGEPAAGFTWSEDDAENRKQLDAALLAGAGAIALDNVTAPVGGDRLNQMVTQARVTVRVLGQSRTADVPCSAFVTANGNNLQIAADMTRRTLLCRMDRGTERPELHTFKSDPVRMVRENRGTYVTAALTILRAYHVATRPEQPAALGSFNEWSSWVRGALIWLGCDDPVASMDTVRADDPRRNELFAVVEQWDAVIGARRVTAAQLIEAATAGVGTADFREALLAIAGAAGAINTKRLGRWLAANRDKPIGEMKIVQSSYREGSRLWALEGGRAAAADNVVPLHPAREFPAVREDLTLDELLR